ncbi:hypothetical protein ACWD4J_33385 [Streptomyces sp. NPDC002577]
MRDLMTQSCPSSTAVSVAVIVIVVMVLAVIVVMTMVVQVIAVGVRVIRAVVRVPVVLLTALHVGVLLSYSLGDAAAVVVGVVPSAHGWALQPGRMTRTVAQHLPYMCARTHT